MEVALWLFRYWSLQQWFTDSFWWHTPSSKNAWYLTAFLIALSSSLHAPAAWLPTATGRSGLPSCHCSTLLPCLALLLWLPIGCSSSFCVRIGPRLQRSLSYWLWGMHAAVWEGCVRCGCPATAAAGGLVGHPGANQVPVTWVLSADSFLQRHLSNRGGIKCKIWQGRAVYLRKGTWWASIHPPIQVLQHQVAQLWWVKEVQNCSGEWIVLLNTQKPHWALWEWFITGHSSSC